MSSSWNEEYRFGSARWAELHELHRTGMIGPKGLPVGYAEGRLLRYASDAPMITIAGAGSGKLRDVIGPIFCEGLEHPTLVLDPRGEIAATFMPSLTRTGVHAYTFNPFGLHGLPSHACNALDFIDPNLASFYQDCTLAAQALIAVRSKPDGGYFEERASSWVEAILRHIAEVLGAVTLKDLMGTINLIESGLAAWPDFLEGMMRSRFADVRRTAGEMLTKQQDSQREFGSIMGSIYAGLAVLDDPALQSALGRSEFSMAQLCQRGASVAIFLIVPAEYLRQMAPVLRLLITAARVHKGRAPGSGRLHMLIDEAAQLGHFYELQQLYTFGRGQGFLTQTFWQGVGQLFDNYGPTGAQTFLGSSGLQQIFGVRDVHTAKLISDQLGTETLEFDDSKAQEMARHQKMQAMQRFVGGGDPFEAAIDMMHYDKMAGMRSKQARKKMTEEEILTMPADKQILFLPGLNLHPYCADRRPYYERPEYAGRYLANPYHAPLTHVQIATRWGLRSVRIIREGVPKRFESFPQYRDGTWAYVEGYKPT